MTESRALPAPLRGIRAAFVFLTRLPLGGFPYHPAELAWAAAHGPLVGAVVGASTGAVFTLLLPVGAPGAAVLAVAFSLIVTGALHEDGLADTCDALGGSFDRERALAILKDSRIGAFGGAALVVSILARTLLIANLSVDAVWALAVVGAVARVGPVLQIGALPYVTPDDTSKSRDLVQSGAAQSLVASLWAALAVALAVLLGPLTVVRGVVLAAVVAAVTFVTGLVYSRRVGGVTGDFLGATEQVAEIFALVVVVWGAA